MNLQKLNPWNWFKHEESGHQKNPQIPITGGGSGNVPTSYSGADSLFSLHREMDRLFDDVFNSFGMKPIRSGLASSPLLGDNTSNFYQPQIDVSGNEKSYEIMLDVPGLSESDLSIEVKDDVLTIKGQKEVRSESNENQFYRVERSYGSFQRTLSLPDDASAEDMKANLINGVLKLEIPRQEALENDVKRIPISS